MSTLFAGFMVVVSPIFHFDASLVSKAFLEQVLPRSKKRGVLCGILPRSLVVFQVFILGFRFKIWAR